MSRLRIAAIVEGDGEVEAVPILIRRYADLAGWPGVVDMKAVIRQSASWLLKPRELERTVELAARKLRGPGGIFVLLDCEDDCPARLGPELLARIHHARRDLPTALVLAHREYEAWFLGAAASVAGHRGLPSGLEPHPSPESIRGCKEWLSDKMPPGRSYDTMNDQPALTKVFDLSAAKSACPSFDKCHRELVALLRRVAEVTPDFVWPIP